MMGRTHAWTGAAAGAGLALALDLGPIPTLAAVAVCAGSALLPDTDHPDSTAAHCAGPISQLFASLVCFMAGGHRRGTHSLVGDGIFAGIVAYGMFSRQGALAALHAHFGPKHTPLGGSPLAWAGLFGTLVLAWILVVVYAGLVRVVIGYPPGWVDDLIPIPLAFLTLWQGGKLEWLPVAVFIGCLIHQVGDMLTPEGCPMLWPFTEHRFSVDLFTTNRWPEHLIVFPLTVFATGWLLATHAGLI